MSMANLLFVYGTLKRGLCRHSFLADSQFKGLGKSTGSYRMVSVGDYPGLIHEPNGRPISGEVYQVDDETLRRLDIVEGVAEGLYRRDWIDLISPWNQEQVATYFYSLPTEGMIEVEQWPPVSGG